ncbi:uncharacterized protein [Montipora foliosa]|uniref:uncharacterized protein isoform X1 n=1 Tax=Montipora foliosa TaxID=591990 RepID=UPI0035F15A7D
MYSPLEMSLLGFIMISVLQTDGSRSDVKWPEGKYGLPMASSGCPKAKGFSWQTGFIYQDLEDNNSRTTTSLSFHLRAAIVNSNDVLRGFCIKTTQSSAVDLGRPSWPYGNYCIYKKGSTCPSGLQPGWVLWDDENGKNGLNLNFRNGSIPNGIYKQDTKISFCCQDVGSVDDPIELPIDEPFYLIAFNSKRCQEVLKAIHTAEFIRYDTENDNNHDSWGYTHPYGVGSNFLEIYYCYYKACRWNLSSLNGTFWSPNYPNDYKNKVWCEWNINAPSGYIISLTFEDFRLENVDFCHSTSCECDYVDIRETFANGTSILIGKYCMGVAFPHGEIKSRGNNMTVIFRSDNWIVEPGFKARYQVIPVTVSTSAPDQQTTEITGFTQANSSTKQTPEILPTSSATKEDGKHQISNDENAENGNVRLIIAVITSSIVAAGVVAVPLVCFFRRRRLKGSLQERNGLTVTFTARKNTYEDSSVIPFTRDDDGKSDEGRSYVTNVFNAVCENRASFSDSIDKFEADDEMKESDNPLYSSSVENEQDNNNIIYESMDDITTEAESSNPVYEGMV